MILGFLTMILPYLNVFPNSNCSSATSIGRNMIEKFFVFFLSQTRLERRSTRFQNNGPEAQPGAAPS